MSAAMNALLVQIKKGRNGPDVLTCVRADGTRTWEHLQPSIAVHDLAHFAVESELGFRSGFYGLLASGWSVTRFLERESRRELPREAGEVECLVGRFWQELWDASCPDADEFNATQASIAAVRPELACRSLTQDEIDRVRAKLRDLVVQWTALKPGETLELEFDPSRARC
jgi:hypothetical protein